jgi:hypothetical protein
MSLWYHKHHKLLSGKLKLNYRITTFAQVYGACNYGVSTDQNGTCMTGATTSTSSGGTLSNTGFDVALAIAVASAIIFVALLVRFFRRPSKNNA